MGDGGSRNGHNVRLLGQDDPRVGEHAGQELVLGIAEGRLNGDRPGVGVDLRFDRRQFGPKHLARIRVRGYLNRLSGSQLGLGLLRQGEVNPQGVEVGERHHRFPGAHNLAKLDLAHAQHPGKWCSDKLLIDERLRARDTRAGLIQRCPILVDAGLGGEITVGEGTRPVEIGLRQTLLRFQAREVRAFGGIVQLQ